MGESKQFDLDEAFRLRKVHLKRKKAIKDQVKAAAAKKKQIEEAQAKIREEAQKKREALIAKRKEEMAKKQEELAKDGGDAKAKEDADVEMSDAKGASEGEKPQEAPAKT